MADKCEAYRLLIEEGAGGGAAGGRALASHLAACEGCREFRREREALVGLLGGLPAVGAPEDFEFRLRARMASRRPSERTAFWQLRFTPGLAALAVATCLLAAATLYFRTRQNAENLQQTVAARGDAPAAPPAEVRRTAIPPEVTGGAPRAVDPAAAAQTLPRPGRELASYAPREKRGAARPRRAAVNEGTFTVGTAPIIPGPPGGAGPETGSRSASEAVALRTSPETLRVVLRDERGAPYLLPMRSVSFGSQTPVGRAANTTRVALTDKGGVW